MTKPTDAAIVATWRVRLAIRKRLLARATKARPKNPALVSRRVEQVHKAERVIARHSPPPPRSVSSAGLALIERFEGFRANIYKDSVGVWTQGFGETRGTTLTPWTREYAQQRLEQRVNHDYLPAVLRAASAGRITLKQRELDALVSLCYNVGPGVFDVGHTMGNAIRSGDRERIVAAFSVYDVAGGHVLPGLRTRRQDEQHFFRYGR